VFAVLGDSLSTGAALHPALNFDSLALWQVLKGEISVAVEDRHYPPGYAPLREPAAPLLWPTIGEFRTGVDWLARTVTFGIFAKYLNSVQLSWSQLLGQKLGVRPENILIAAENGARIETLARQFERVRATGKQPTDVFIFFSGNDVCAPTPMMATPPETYAKRLETGIRFLRRTFKGQIYVLGHLGLGQLVLNKSIQDKAVYAFGEQSTCGELRKKQFRPAAAATRLPPSATMVGYFLPPNPAMLCATVFMAEEPTAVANQVRAIRRAATAAVDRLKAADLGPITIVEEVGELEFAGEDIAVDCFHLSSLGQAKIAQTVQVAIETPDKTR
jgi:lysophospholipase L1-like esterase